MSSISMQLSYVQSGKENQIQIGQKKSFHVYENK